MGMPVGNASRFTVGAELDVRLQDLKRCWQLAEVGESSVALQQQQQDPQRLQIVARHSSAAIVIMHASIGMQRSSALSSGLPCPGRQSGLRLQLRYRNCNLNHHHLTLGQQQLRPGVRSQQRDVQQPAAQQKLEVQHELGTDTLTGPSKQQPQQKQKQPQQPDPQQRRGPLRWLRRNVSRLSFFAKAGEGQDARFDIRALLQQLRVLMLGCMMGCVLLVVRYSMLHQARTAPREVLYSDFVTLLNTGKVKAARLEAASSKLIFELHPQEAAAATGAAAAKGSSKAAASSSKGSAAASVAAAAAAEATAAAKPAPNRRFYIKLADKQDPLLVGKVLTAGIEFAVVRASFQQQLQQMLLTMLALWIPLLPLLLLVFRAMDSRNGTAAKRRNKGGPNTPRVTFADVAGVASAKEELREVVACLRNAQQYARVGAKMPSGVLLCGPPGTGKTLLAKAVAGEAGVPFIAVSASEFVELFVGRGAARVRELFAEARKSSPCVVFIDELDAIGGKRGTGFNDERDQTLNQLLTELDGFEGRSGVMLLAATNRVDVLDPALLRPGRISRRVTVPLPDEAGRAAILGVHLRDITLDESAGDKTQVARQLATLTAGFSGAELSNIVNEALLLTARRGGEAVGLAELLEGLSRTRYGVNGGNGARQTALGRRLGKWLMNSLQQQQSKAVKVATS